MSAGAEPLKKPVRAPTMKTVRVPRAKRIGVGDRMGPPRRVAEEPEEVLPQERLAAALRQEEARPHRPVEEKHHSPGNDRADRQHEQDGGGELHPEDEWQAERGKG